MIMELLTGTLRKTKILIKLKYWVLTIHLRECIGELRILLILRAKVERLKKLIKMISLRLRNRSNQSTSIK